jgi:cytochrome P450
MLGHETTAGALTWTVHILSTHPEMQARLLKEVEEAISKSQAPTYEQIESLNYLNNFTREVLRVYPPGIGICTLFLSHTYLQEVYSCIRTTGSG